MIMVNNMKDKVLEKTLILTKQKIIELEQITNTTQYNKGET